MDLLIPPLSFLRLCCTRRILLTAPKAIELAIFELSRVHTMADQGKTTARPNAQPAEESTPIQITPISNIAGGVPSIIEAAKSAWGQMGPMRGTRALLKLN